MRKQNLKAKLRPYAEKADREQAKRKKGKTALYRHFDKDGQLLYVGISLSHVARLAQHRDGSPWYEDIAHVTIEWHKTRVEAELAETKAIGREAPKYNKNKVQCEKNLERLSYLEKDEIMNDVPIDPQVLHKFWKFAEQMNEWHQRMGAMEEEFQRVTDVWDDIVKVIKDIEGKYSWLDDRRNLIEVKQRQDEFNLLKGKIEYIEFIFDRLRETKSGSHALERAVKSAPSGIDRNLL
jgi:phage-related minor tail protein